MDTIQFVIQDYYEMLNLHKALLEAKFHETPDNQAVAGSPIVAKLYDDLLNQLAECELRKKGKENWTEWRKLKNQSFYKERAIGHIVKSDQWKLLEDDQREKFIYNYFSPFTYTKEELSMLIHEIDCRFHA